VITKSCDLSGFVAKSDSILLLGLLERFDFSGLLSKSRSLQTESLKSNAGLQINRERCVKINVQ
jgi:hypothetical protein